MLFQGWESLARKNSRVFLLGLESTIYTITQIITLCLETNRGRAAHPPQPHAPPARSSRRPARTHPPLETGQRAGLRTAIRSGI